MRKARRLAISHAPRLLMNQLKAICFALGILLSPLATLAAEDENQLEARLENYATGVRLASSGTALTWLFLIFLTVCVAAVLFKDAKRTHLD